MILGQKEKITRKQAVKRLPDEKTRLVAVADIHGDLSRLKGILAHAGLIDQEGRWTGGPQILVLLGDMIDRTPQDTAPEEAYLFARYLQGQAEKAGGRVVRLIGNHELMLLQGELFHFFMSAGFGTRQKRLVLYLTDLIRRDVMKGRLCAAYVHGDVLFSHAGLRSKVRRFIKREIHLFFKETPLEFEANFYTQPYVMELMINKTLVEAVERDDYSHPIFWIGQARGGDKEVGGIFWTDFGLELYPSLGAKRIRQVVGHSPRGLKGHIVLDQKGKWRIICMDTAISRGFGPRGFASYLEMEPDVVRIWRQKPTDGSWAMAKELPDRP